MNANVSLVHAVMQMSHWCMPWCECSLIGMQWMQMSPWEYVMMLMYPCGYAMAWMSSWCMLWCECTLVGMQWCECPLGACYDVNVFLVICNDANVPLVHVMMRVPLWWCAMMQMPPCGYVVMRMSLWCMQWCECTLVGMQWRRCPFRYAMNANVSLRVCHDENVRLGVCHGVNVLL